MRGGKVLQTGKPEEIVSSLTTKEKEDMLKDE